jgi:hypothetical protein
MTAARTPLALTSSRLSSARHTFFALSHTRVRVRAWRKISFLCGSVILTIASCSLSSGPEYTLQTMTVALPPDTEERMSAKSASE